VFTSAESTRLSVLNGSHCELGSAHTVLVFPDYKLVKDVPATVEGAAQFWKAAVDPAVGIEGKRGEGEMKSWVLPYAAVILLCKFDCNKIPDAYTNPYSRLSQGTR
jgi:hypothetical protein